MRQYRKRKKLSTPPSPASYSSWSWSKLSFDADPINLILSFFGAGYLPFMPGTWGSVAALILCFFLLPFLNMLTYTLLITFLFFLGVILLISLYHREDRADTDPSYVVIDEAVGQMIAILPVLYHVEFWPVAFLLFRYFDIQKPLLVSWPDQNLHGTSMANAFGIMLDDILAGMYAAGITYCAHFSYSSFIHTAVL